MGQLQRLVLVVSLVPAGAIACGGSASRDASSAHGGAAATAAGGASGAGGSLVISDEPASCFTADGMPGISVILLPYSGAELGCEATRQPGAADPACPRDAFYRCDPLDCYQAETLAGCCRPDGSCGLLDVGFFGADQPLGCISRQRWIDHAAFLGRSVTPATCGN
jgi:hypothetical protein